MKTDSKSKMMMHMSVVFVATLFLTAPASAGRGDPCDGATDALEVSATLAGVDVNGLVGTSNHYPLVQFVVRSDAALHDVSGSIFEWGRDGGVSFTYDAMQDAWVSETIENPTPDEPIRGLFTGTGMIGFYRTCESWTPIGA